MSSIAALNPGSRWSSLSTRAVSTLATAAGSLLLWATIGAGGAAAADPCGTSGVRSQSAASVTCTYSTAGTEDTFTVPDGITAVSVTAVGAAGGDSQAAGAGAPGALVGNTALPVTAGAGLWVDVGGPGAFGSCFSFDPGGFPDGGDSPICSGGGGGSSAVLTAARTAATLNGDPTSDSRLLVAGGGGGGGQGFGAGSAGDPTVTGAGAGGCISTGGAGGVGPADGSDGGGAGGCAPFTDVCQGGAGTASKGGVGASFCRYGGGGGGGWFAGGGGGGLVGAFAGGAGGGGGSSYAGAGPAAGTSVGTAPAGQAPEVTITWMSSAAPDLAAALVLDSRGKGPGTALADKAAAIAAAVNAGQTASACAGIANYIGLIKAQTAKKLSPANATLLTTDTTNLAKALGC
jgi:hypothetical protein